ncbi:WbqC family protein [Pseudozobellia thermophila]|uniref:WbqC-like protein family protein n=1 Tax=Pseudozobellia thermophila TaxID=192903 RepID=A0A1M6J300_9FLAO|nr:WbqC family protein [Pseudozobellia thermophila]SHJ40911.1 WbqC-like protein family protein [Pseudozobellia thermophila]
MKTLLHPGYFPNIITFANIVQKDIVWEVEDNYQKQTYRNRCYICTDQGRHMLSIPIQHVGGDQGRQKYKEVVLENSYSWQRQHWRTLQTAYRTSPFFEYYEDDMAPLFEKRFSHLLDFNLKTIETVCECLQVDMPTEKTTGFELKPEGVVDLRELVNAKRTFEMDQPAYTQVFGERHGFIENTSILDLLFNEGTNALAYLRQLNTEK